jgi:anti-sigma B factor antagonist
MATQDPQVTVHVRYVSPAVSIIDIEGDVTAFADTVLTNAYNAASTNTTKTIILNFSGLEYMNSSGIGLLVTLLIRMNRKRQRLFAFGLTDHYKNIFDLTRLNEAIGIYETEADAVKAATGAS